jgi:hypothetical protein
LAVIDERALPEFQSARQFIEDKLSDLSKNADRKCGVCEYPLAPQAMNGARLSARRARYREPTL